MTDRPPDHPIAGERSVAPRGVLSRRAILAGAASCALLAACGQGEPQFRVSIPSPGGVTTTDDGAIVTSGLLTTRHWPGHSPTWILMRPTAVARPPLVISLHGKGGDARESFTGLGLNRFVRSTGLAVAAIDGGNYYWHARRSESTGDDDISPDTPPCDTGAMVVDDFVPMLSRFGVDVARLGFIGWSMGGYGALLLSATLGAARVRAVAPMSAALWTEPGDSAPGAFDDAADWAAHNVFAERDRFSGMPVRLAVGTSDPFYAADQAFVDGFPSDPAYDVTGVYGPGGHDTAFWASHAGAQMAFLARYLRD